MTVSPADLTGTERAVLLVLMAESRPVPNPELLALGPKLDKPGRDKLNTLGLIESQRSGGRFVHELTDRGWRLCRDIASAGPPPRSTGPAKTLYTVLGALIATCAAPTSASPTCSAPTATSHRRRPPKTASATRTPT